MKKKENKMKHFRAFGLIVLLAASSAFAQTPAPKPAPTFTLTPAESSQVTVRNEQMNNLQANFKQRVTDMQEQAQRINTQMQTAKTQLVTQIAKAHGVDLTKYKLDEATWTFVPIAPPAAKQ